MGGKPYVNSFLIPQLKMQFFHLGTHHSYFNLHMNFSWNALLGLSLDCKSILSPFSGTTGTSLVAQMVKNLPAVQKTGIRSLGQEEPLEKGMATHSSTLAWKILWTEVPGRLQSMGSQRIGQDWVTKHNRLKYIKYQKYLFEHAYNLHAKKKYNLHELSSLDKHELN